MAISKEQFDRETANMTHSQISAMRIQNREYFQMIVE
jgi:hypothetical protein